MDTQLHWTLCDPLDYSPPGSSVRGILQARILEWVAVPSFRGSFQCRNWTCVSCIAGRFFTQWATTGFDFCQHNTYKHTHTYTQCDGSCFSFVSFLFFFFLQSGLDLRVVLYLYGTKGRVEQVSLCNLRFLKVEKTEMSVIRGMDSKHIDQREVILSNGILSKNFSI